MATKLLSVFIIFSFVCTSILEIQADNYSLESSTISTYKKEHSQSQLVNILENFYSNDCKDDNCPIPQSCSSCFCLCTSCFFINPNNTILNNLSSLPSKVNWYMNNFYQSPYLDPALKPPLFS